MTWPFGHLQMFGYDVVEIDPPTEFELYSENGNEKSASAQYKTMSWEELAAYPVGQLARSNAIALLWACTPTIRESFWLLDQWGAKYKSMLVWPKDRYGTGYRVRGRYEFVILGVFGDERQIHTAFDQKIPGKTREHSRKPDEFYDEVVAKTPGLDRCSLFSRQSREGWATWGDQATLFDAAPATSRKRVKRIKPAPPLAPVPLFDLEVAA